MKDQPTPAVTTEDVQRVVLREFSTEDAESVLTMLNEYGTEEWHREHDRVRLAALKLAGGKIDSLRAAIETAKLDYRDVLAAAEYPRYLRLVDPSGSLPAEEKQRVIDADWKQYSEWLAR